MTPENTIKSIKSYHSAKHLLKVVKFNMKARYLLVAILFSVCAGYFTLLFNSTDYGRDILTVGVTVGILITGLSIKTSLKVLSRGFEIKGKAEAELMEKVLDLAETAFNEKSGDTPPSFLSAEEKFLWTKGYEIAVKTQPNQGPK